MRTLLLESLVVRDFRNLRRADLLPAPRFNVLVGRNGQGKTSLLEAIYFVATTKSFRTARAAELVSHGADVASVRGRFNDRDADARRDQVAAIQRGRVSVKIDDNRPSSLIAYATRSPVVAFHPDELALTSGPAAGRRTLLDRVALFVDPACVEARSNYLRALKSRQRLLQGYEPSGGALDAFEDLAARNGAALTAARARAVAVLADELRAAFSSIAAPDLTLEVRYAPGGSEDADVARVELASARARDAHRNSAGFGPHRDDLELLLDGRLARVVASQGQHRALTLALKGAEAAAIGAARGVEPILLLDDVSSELDADRTSALFRFIATFRGQVFLTTTRRELIDAAPFTANDRADFVVDRGEVRALETP